MSDPLDIGAFLARAAQDGQTDGSGEFTVAHEQAARKLARFSLPRSSAWVAKLVQAAVRFQARSLEIKQSLSETFFHLELDQVPGEDAIVSAIVSGSIDRGRALDALSLSLRALVEQGRLSFLLVADDGRAAPRPIYAGKHYSKLTEKARLDPRFHPRPGLSLTVYHRPLRLDPYDPEELLQSWRGHAPILQELRTACFASPLPLLSKGRQLDGLLDSPALDLSELNRLLLVKGLDPLRHSPPSLPLPADFEGKQPSLLSHPQRLRRSYRGSRQAQAALTLSLHLDRAATEPQRWSRLLWLSDGVLVQEEKLQVATRALQLTLLANGAGLATDLTGFSLVDNEHFRQRREEVLRAAGQALTEAPRPEDLFRDDRDQWSPDDDRLEARQTHSQKATRLLKGSGSVLALAVLNPLLSAPAVAGVVLSSYQARRRPRAERLLQRTELLAEAFEWDRQTLVAFLTSEEPPPPPGRTVQFVTHRG